MASATVVCIHDLGFMVLSFGIRGSQLRINDSYVYSLRSMICISGFLVDISDDSLEFMVYISYSLGFMVYISLP